MDRITAAQQELNAGQASQGQASSSAQKQSQQGQPKAITTDEATPMSNGMQNAFQSATVQRSPSQDKRAASERVPSAGSSQGKQSNRPPPLPQYKNDRPRQRSPAGKRITSPTGGVQVTLDGKSSWSDLARQDATLPTDANAAGGDGSGRPEQSGGVFGFLSRKKGRSHSPKPKERGVLGKEGARVVIG
jgi:serine/threonine kinase 32